MVRYVLDAATQGDVRATVVVVGHHATWVEKELSAGASPLRPLTFVEQREQLGTGHAVSVELAAIDEAKMLAAYEKAMAKYKIDA